MRAAYDKLTYQILGLRPTNRPFIFGVGLSKTATTSLNDAMEDLGIDAVHLPPVTRVQDGKIHLDPVWWTWKHTAWTDLSSAAVYAELWRACPKARFIYTVRDREAWLDSCARHFTVQMVENRVRQRNFWVLELCLAFYGTVLYDRDLFMAAYDRHEEGVLSLMEGSDRFLKMDITGGDGWEALCGFLGHPVPDRPFPASNIQGRGKG